MFPEQDHSLPIKTKSIAVEVNRLDLTNIVNNPTKPRLLRELEGTKGQIAFGEVTSFGSLCVLVAVLTTSNPEIACLVPGLGAITGIFIAITVDGVVKQRKLKKEISSLKNKSN